MRQSETARMCGVTICQWCDSSHAGVCPRVSSLGFRLDGSLESVAFWDQERAGDLIVEWLANVSVEALDEAMVHTLEEHPGTAGAVALAVLQRWSSGN